MRYLIHNRRNALKRKEFDTHRSLALEIEEQEEICGEWLSTHILEHLDITADQFFESYQTAINNPDSSNVENQDKLDLEVAKIIINKRSKEIRENPNGKYLIRPKDLTREETLQIFEAQSQL